MGKKIYKDYIEYICDLCDKNFGNKKDNYERHLNRKYPCIKNSNIDIVSPPLAPCPEAKTPPFALDMIDEEENKECGTDFCIEIIKDEQKESEYICEFCKRCFSKKYNLERHIKNVCKKTTKKMKEIDNNEGIKEQIEILIKQSVEDKINNEIKKELDLLKKENEKLKKEIKRTKSNKITNKTTNINNQQNINQQNINVNQNNILINFNDLDLEGMDKKLFTNPLLNSRLQGKFIILQMIENVYINEAHPEYQNIMITDKNRGYVKIYNNGKWKTDNINTMNMVIDGIISHSKNILIELKQQYVNNVGAKNRLNTSEKYVNLCDLEYLENLEDEQINDNVDNKDRIKRCKEFREMVFDDTVNLFHDNKKLLLKQK